MRIIGGSARGRAIRAPKGWDTRPTRDRVRQSLFDVLGQRCDGERVLDLFAGTGALGLEALSRGADHCVFVEQAPAALEAIRRNLETLGFQGRAEVIRGDALTVPGSASGATLVFADPPYALGATSVVEALAATAGVLVEGARVVIEHGRHERLSERVGPLRLVDSRRYGDTEVGFYLWEGPLE